MPVCRDAEEAMLAAAIRASLIEADEQHASSSAQDDTAPSSMTQPHASSSAQDNKPMTTGQHETRSPVSDSRRHDRSEQQQPSSSRQAAETQQRNSESSPLPDGERTHQSSSSSSSQKPPRQSFRNSHSAAALYSLDHEPNAATGSGQQSSRNGYSSSLSQQQQAQRDQLASDLRKISLQAGSAQAVGSSKQPAQRMHLLHQTHTQPAADVGHGSSTASQVMRQQYLGRGQNEHHGDQQQSPVQQDRGSVKQQHSPRSALQPSGK